jgi:hypothetical protein
MTINEKSAAVSGIISFNDLLDETCEKLMDKQIKNSIRRILEMEERLANMEKELDEFLKTGN